MGAIDNSINITGSSIIDYMATTKKHNQKCICKSCQRTLTYNRSKISRQQKPINNQGTEKRQFGSCIQEAYKTQENKNKETYK